MEQRKWIVVLLLCLLVLFGCDAAQADQGTTTGDTPTDTPTETVAQRINDVVQSAQLAGSSVKVTLSGSELTVSEDLSQYDLGGSSLILTNIKQGCYDLQKAVWTSAISKGISQVQLRATTDTQDQYGKVSHGTLVGYCILTQKTASLFGWDNLDSDSAWKVYSNTWLIPFLSQ